MKKIFCIAVVILISLSIKAQSRVSLHPYSYSVKKDSVSLSDSLLIVYNNGQHQFLDFTISDDSDGVVDTLLFESKDSTTGVWDTTGVGLKDMKTGIVATYNTLIIGDGIVKTYEILMQYPFTHRLRRTNTEEGKSYVTIRRRN